MRRPLGLLRTTLLGGLVVVLPVAVTMAAFLWLYGVITRLIGPVAVRVEQWLGTGALTADLIAMTCMLLTCFFLGLIVRTQAGKIWHLRVERGLLSKIPGYSMIRETIVQFIGRNRSPFSSVALVRIFENATRVTGFVTEEHADGTYTIFVPTGPNPTSGNIYHVQGEYVQKIDASVEETMRSIISCGAGSAALLHGKHPEHQ